jgi:hypothetical protein
MYTPDDEARSRVFKHRTAAGEAARYMALLGGIMLILSLFFRWSLRGDAFGTFQQDQLWLLTLAIAIIAIAVIDMFVASDGFLPIAGSLGMLAFGGPFFFRLEFQLDQSGAGWFVCLVGGGLVAAAGVVSIIDLAKRASAGVQSHTVEMPVNGPLSQEPPPGWYPDPAAEAAYRFWSGAEWTTDVQ